VKARKYDQGFFCPVGVKPMTRSPGVIPDQYYFHDQYVVDEEIERRMKSGILAKHKSSSKLSLLERIFGSGLPI
jgi:hypothetical protein